MPIETVPSSAYLRRSSEEQDYERQRLARLAVIRRATREPDPSAPRSIDALAGDILDLYETGLQPG